MFRLNYFFESLVKWLLVLIFFSVVFSVLLNFGLFFWQGIVMFVIGFIVVLGLIGSLVLWMVKGISRWLLSVVLMCLLVRFCRYFGVFGQVCMLMLVIDFVRLVQLVFWLMLSLRFLRFFSDLNWWVLLVCMINWVLEMVYGLLKLKILCCCLFIEIWFSVMLYLLFCRLVRMLFYLVVMNFGLIVSLVVSSLFSLVLKLVSLLFCLKLNGGQVFFRVMCRVLCWWMLLSSLVWVSGVVRDISISRWGRNCMQYFLGGNECWLGLCCLFSLVGFVFWIIVNLLGCMWFFQGLWVLIWIMCVSVVLIWVLQWKLLCQ